MTQARIQPLFYLGLVLLQTGCGTVSKGDRLSEFNTLYSTGQYQAAVDTQLQSNADEVEVNSDLLANLLGAAALRLEGQYNESAAIFDACEDIMQRNDQELMASRAVGSFAAVLTNDKALGYSGYEYDGVMVNTYKALDSWKLGKLADARVEFNRAVDRQDRAKVRFSKLVERNQAELERKKAEQAEVEGSNSGAIDFDKNIDDPEINKLIYSNMAAFEAYSDFSNPFTFYSAGLFFMAVGDYAKSVDLLKEASGMDPTNAQLAADFHLVNELSSGGGTDQKYVWVVFENGLGPELQEYRVDLPLVLFSDEVIYSGIALPQINLREQAYPYLIARTDKQGARTAVVGSMDRVVQSEFKKRYPILVSRAITATLVKTFAQYQGEKEYGKIAGLGAALYQMLSTSADLRIWSALPKDFQVARLDVPADGVLQLESPEGVLQRIEISPTSHAVVYVKAVTAQTPPVVEVIQL